MKYYNIIIAITVILKVLAPIPCLSQDWQWQNPLPQGDRLEEIQFVGSLYGWILTEGGTILRTIDGGNSWSVEVSVNEINRWAQKIYFIDQSRGWIVGSGAPPFIMRTQDGGLTWENLPIPVERNTNEFYYNFRGLHFLDSLNGYITDDFGGIFHTKNGGLSWEKQSTNLRPKREIKSIFFVDSLKGFAIGATPLLYTQDGGSNWSRDSTIVGGIDALPRKIFFADTLHGWILTGDEKFYRTDDGGMNWKQHIIDSMAVGHFLHHTFGEFIAREFMFLNPQQGWLSTSWGMHSSLDSGKTWHRINTEFDYDGVYFVNTKIGWATGGVQPSLRNEYFRTLDGGVTWQSQTSKITEQTLWGVDFIDENTGWAVGDGTILHTTDGGETWGHQTNPSTSWLKKVIFINRTEGWIVGFGGTILHTKNGGQTWERQESGTTYALVEASFISSQKGWVVGWSLDTTPVSGIVLHTSNSGVSWQNQTPEGMGRLFGVAFIDSLHGWIATGGGTVWDDGQLYRTQDGGQNWELQIHKPDDTFGRIVFVDSLYGWVAALKGILQTTDGGITWETKAKAMSMGLFNIRFVDRCHGWAVGNGGRITHTSDGGENWVWEQSKTCLTLWDIDFANENSGWAVGDFGTILHTGKDGATSFENKPNPPLFPLCFELYQNYPNPFNNKTVLNFSLYEPYAKVTLNIYNTRGQLVTTLLNDQLAAGFHRVIWNGTDESGEIVGSGVYLYRTNVNRLNKAGKMILLR